MLDWIKDRLERFFNSRKKSRKKKTKKRVKRKARLQRKTGKTKKPNKDKKNIVRVQKKSVTTSKASLPIKVTKNPPKVNRYYRTGVSKVTKAEKIPKALPGKSVGKITHYFSKIQVAVMRVDAPLKVGDKIDVRRKGESIGKENVRSMQINHIPIDEARKGEEIGMKLQTSVLVGDELFIL